MYGSVLVDFYLFFCTLSLVPFLGLTERFRGDGDLYLVGDLVVLRLTVLV